MASLYKSSSSSFSSSSFTKSKTGNINDKISTSTSSFSPSAFDVDNLMEVGKSNDFFTRFLGALALLTMWIVWISGCFFYVIAYKLYVENLHLYLGIWILLILFPFFSPLPKSRLFLQAIMLGCGWFDKGATLYIEEEVGKYNIEKKILLCMHPHGLFCYGYFLNGASCRALADSGGYSGQFLPKNFQHMPKDTFGVVEPNLFKIPMILPFLQLFGMYLYVRIYMVTIYSSCIYI